MPPAAPTLSDPLTLWAALATLAAAVLLVAWMRARGHGARLQAALDEARPYRDQAQALREALMMEEVQAQRVPELEAARDTAQARYQTEYELRLDAQHSLRALRREHEARLEELRGMKKDIEDRFNAVASVVLQQNSEAFLTLVSERFKAHEQGAQEDLERRRAAIEGLVKPLSERLGQFGEQVQAIEKSRSEAYGAIHQQVRALAEGQVHLSQETRKLVQALRAPKTRGRWGEMQLRQVFEMAGMSENVDFRLEQHMATDAGGLRPDAVVHIPGGRSIVVDAKTPLEAYLDALEAETPDLQNAALTRHAAHVRAHVKTLSSKAYHAHIEGTPDFVVMFIPGETFVAAAAEADPGLIEYAFAQKVLIASPTTLMALVKAIAYGWQQEKMARNAVEIQKTAKELHERLKTFGSHVDGIGRALTQSVERYNRAVGSLESRVLPSARKLEGLGVVQEEDALQAPAQVESTARTATLPQPDHAEIGSR